MNLFFQPRKARKRTKAARRTAHERVVHFHDVTLAEAKRVTSRSFKRNLARMKRKMRATQVDLSPLFRDIVREPRNSRQACS